MEYYLDDHTIDKNYGVYDLLKYMEENSYIKSFGAINKDKYIFMTDIYDHYGALNETKEKIGDFSIYFAIDLKDYGYTFNIYAYHYVKPNSFIYESVIGILNECMKFQKEFNVKIELSITNLLFQDRKERKGNEINKVINDLKIEQDNIRDKLTLEYTKEESKININLDKLKSIFKKDTKKKGI